MKNMKYIPQFIQTECGLCCIAMIANYYGLHITLAELREYQQPGRDGISAKDLCKILEWLQFDYKLYKSNVRGLKKLNYPLIAFSEDSHFIVIEKLKKDSIYVIDPAMGKVIYSFEEFQKIFSGIVLYPYPKLNTTIKLSAHNPLRKSWHNFFSLFLTNKMTLAGVIAFSVLAYVASLTVSYFIQHVIDAGNSITIMLICSAFLILFGYVTASLINSLLTVILKSNVYKTFFKQTFIKVTQLPYSFFENRTASSITYNLDCIDVINDVYASQIINVGVSLGALLILSIYFLKISFQVYTILVILVLLLTALLFFSNRYIVKLKQTEINSKEKLREFQLEFVTAVECIKIGGMEQKFLSKWVKQFDMTVDKTIKRGIAQALYATVSSTFQIALPVSMLFVSLYFVSRRKLTIGQAISLYSLVSIIVANIMEIISVANNMQLIDLYLARITDITDEPSETNGTFKIDKIKNIEIKNLSFRYNLHSPYVLENISMKFEQGKKIAIVGGSGSGKSTIAKLLIQLYIPTTGEITYNNIPLQQIDKNSLKKVLGMIAQDGVLFNQSILHNITLLCDSYNMDDVVKICKEVHIYDDIMEMPMKFNTVISDSGTNISGGQKQRLILARLLMANPDFLILDEATSALDSITEQEIFSKLSSRGCTQIIIAHRLSTIVDADYIYVLENGKIVEEGKHENLMAQRSIYYSLYQTSQKNIVFDAAPVCKCQ